MLEILRRIIGKHTALVVMSFPKSGRTWHRVMLGHYLSRVTGQEPGSELDLRSLRKKAGLGRIYYTHNGAGFSGSVHYSDSSVASPAEWAGKPVLLIVRDPRDVLVSAYHHARYRSRIYDGDIASFIRSPTTGLDMILAALNRWHVCSHLADKFTVVSYEEMHRQPEEVLIKTLSCLGLNSEIDHVRAAVEFASFHRMKDYEKGNLFGDIRLAMYNQDERGAKVRAGKIGGYVDHLGADDLAYIAERTAEIGDPFSSYYDA